MPKDALSLPWLEPGEAFPPAAQAWGAESQAPGLLAAGGVLDVPSLLRAYGSGVFPWFSKGQPILWWSPDPRMVLRAENFRLHRSLRKSVLRFSHDDRCEIRINSAFQSVIEACASKPRHGQSGTWILPEMQRAYIALHQAGFAHSIECWIDGELQGGLYCVAIGKAVFGESMFAYASNASKIALAALVAICRENGVSLVDCQQNTAHLASLGASEVPRLDFLTHVSTASLQPGPKWQFSPLYWHHVLSA